MKKRRSYWFLGSIYPKKHVNKFTVSIYSDNKEEVANRKYYRHILVDDIIDSFQEVNIDADINFCQMPLQVKRGDWAIYCYTNQNNEIIYGSRPIIEEKIFPLLSQDKLSTQAKLTISSFLKFHGRTFDLIAECEKKMSVEEISFRINIDDFIYTQQYMETDQLTILKNFFKRREFLDKHKANLAICDIALLQNTQVYFDKFCVSIEKILDISFAEIKRSVDELIGLSIERDRIELDICFKQSKLLLAYIMRSEIIIEQRKIERMLSQKVDKVDTSVLEIGYKVDKELGRLGSTLPGNTKKMAIKELELDNDVQSIIDKMIQ